MNGLEKLFINSTSDVLLLPIVDSADIQKYSRNIHESWITQTPSPIVSDMLRKVPVDPTAFDRIEEAEAQTRQCWELRTTKQPKSSRHASSCAPAFKEPGILPPSATLEKQKPKPASAWSSPQRQTADTIPPRLKPCTCMQKACAPWAASRCRAAHVEAANKKQQRQTSF